MNGEYPALRMVATLLKVVGALVGIAGVFVLLYTMAHTWQTGWQGGILMSFGIVLGGLFTFAFGNLIDLLMDIERNTRESAWLARQRGNDEVPNVSL